MKYFSILIFFLSLVACKSGPQKIDTVALVTSNNFKGKIIIFFEQDTTIGNIKLIDGSHYFFVGDSDGIFFTKLALGDGYLEDYTESKNGKLKKENYVSPMAIKSKPDTSYQIVGGSYRGITTHCKSKKGDAKDIRFLPYQAGLLGTFKDHWELRDAFIDSVYCAKISTFH